jgi:hypothetical protein
MGIQFLIPVTTYTLASTDVNTGSLEVSNTATIGGLPVATVNDVTNAMALLAPVENPNFTGVPTAPTAITNTNTTQIATTEYVQNVVGVFAGATINDVNNAIAADITGGVVSKILLTVSSEATRAVLAEYALGESITNEVNRAVLAESLLAPVENPNFTGVPTAPTAVTNTNSTQIATTAYVKNTINAFTGVSPGVIAALGELSAAINSNPNGNAITSVLDMVSSEASRAVLAEYALGESITNEVNRAVLAESLLAPVENPNFTGVPTAPTANANSNSTQIATTEYVNNTINSFTGVSPGVIAALGELSAAIATDPNGSAISALLSTISLETSRAQSVESTIRLDLNNLTGSVSTEVLRAKNVEDSLRTSIDALSGQANNIVDSLDIRGVDGNGNYSFTVGNSSQSGVDEMIIKKGESVLMKISSVGVSGNVGPDMVVFSAPVTMNNLDLSGSLIIGNHTFNQAELVQLGDYFKTLLV